MRLESDVKFEEKLACGLENNMRNLANFHNLTNFYPITRISQKSALMGCFWPKYTMPQLKKYSEVMFDGTQDW